MPQISRAAAIRPVAARTAVAVHPGVGRPASLLALCAALLVAAMLALPAPAQAHDTLLSTDPADGATLETSPEQIAFTFSSDILDVSPLVRISDESGAEIAEIVPAVEGPVATATLPEPLAAGTYDIQWRVVSGDGHPIEGTLTLTVEQDPAAEQTAAPSDAGGAEPAMSDAGGAEGSAEGDEPTTAETGEDEDGAESAGSGLPMPALLGILGVIVVGAVVTGVVILRRRD